jgi:hypothetical protein
MEATKEFLDKNKELGYIEEGESPWSTPWFFTHKKDGTLRPLQDYREVNKWTVRDVYPIPRIEQILEELEGKELFTALDVRWGYHNICIKPEDRWKAAFKTPYGLYLPNVMFFGLTNSPATFQRFMDRIFMPLKRKYEGLLFVYMDDVLIAMPNDRALHREIVHAVLDLMEQESLFLKISKCQFEQATISYLGIVVEHGTIKIDPTKQDGLAAWPRRLHSVKQVRSTLGVFGYHRAFIPGYAHITRPINALLKKDKPFEWTDECTEAMNKLIEAVTSNPVLQRPDYDRPFFLEVDASQFATGAILAQRDERGRLRPVGNLSHSLTPAERNYDVHDRELLAVIRGLRGWRHVLLSSPHPVTVYTDHANLQYYRHPQRINRRVARYLGDLADYNLILVHKPGKNNHADHLSRRPDYDTGADDNTDVTVLPDCLFARVTEIIDLEREVCTAQEEGREELENLKKMHTLDKARERWYHRTQLVVPEKKDLLR